MQKEQKRLIYKLAHGAGDRTLQGRLSKALKRYAKPEKRLESLGAEGSEVRFIAYVRTSQQVLIGVFHKLTRGRAQEVIEMIKDGDEWPVELLTAKTNGKEAREFVEGTLFLPCGKIMWLFRLIHAGRKVLSNIALGWFLVMTQMQEVIVFQKLR